MRGLTRPALIWGTRLGLFFTVVAWIVGQSWTVLGSSPFVAVFLCRHGFMVGHADQMDWDWDPVHSSNGNSPPDEFVDLYFGELPKEQVRAILEGPMGQLSIRCYPGFSVVHGGPLNTRVVCVKHWVLVAMFALLYVALTRIYRKPVEDDS